MHFHFLMEILSNMNCLGHPLSLDRSMSENWSYWSQFCNGWEWTSSITSPHHSMEFQWKTQVQGIVVLILFRLGGKEKELPFFTLSFVKNNKPGKNGKKLPHYHCQYAESLQLSMLCISQIQRLAQPPQRGVEGFLRGAWGLKSKRKSRRFVSTHFSSISHTGISWCLANAKKKKKKKLYFYHYWSRFGCHTVFI